MKGTIHFLLLIAGCFMLNSAIAWGKRGHHIVAEIAFHYLSDADKTKIMSYLHGMTIEDASTWMDEIRNDQKYKYTAPWHYVDFPKGTSYQPTEEPNIVNALTSAIHTLELNRDLSDDSIRFNLLVIIHLIGDIHQPLHVGYPDDKGGNDYQVNYLSKGTNLHKVWDSEIIESQNLTLNSCLRMAEGYRKNNNENVSGINVLEWMKTTRSYTEFVYPSNHKLDTNYVTSELPVIEHQLAIAGLRLTVTLHDVLSHILPPKQINQTLSQTIAVPLDSLNQHIGETVLVCGKVYGVKYLATTKNTPTFINVGAAYPNSPLTLVIWGDVRNSFNKAPEQLAGKNICVSGKLELYKDKPEIVIQKESDITIQQ